MKYKTQTKEKIYVLRSADQTTTKIGRSFQVNNRVDAINIVERKKYYLVYESKAMTEKEAIELEKDIIEKFKDDCIRGREWLSTHPLKVIKYIVGKIGREKKQSILMEDMAEHYVFVASNSKYNSLMYEHLDSIRIDSRYYAYVRTLYQGSFITLGFSNIGDAYKYVQKNRHLQEVVPVITELLFGKTYKEWVTDNLKEYNKLNWLLL